ncbi:hypothetical protein G6F57_017681 [Rhizopus arrhizus]|nr:hypothetical protein G6F57_017681 [Rhizopus arrhizus]
MTERPTQCARVRKASRAAPLSPAWPARGGKRLCVRGDPAAQAALAARDVAAGHAGIHLGTGRQPLARQPHGHAAAHVQQLPRDETRAPVQEQGDAVRHLFRLPDPAHGDGGFQRERLRLAGRVRLVEQFGRDRAWRNGVHGDAVGGQLQRPGARHAGQPRLGRAPAWRMPGNNACNSSTGAVTFKAIVRSRSSSDTSSMLATWIIPALLTRCSTGRSAASSRAASRVAAASPRSTERKVSPGSSWSGARRLKLTT